MPNQITGRIYHIGPTQQIPTKAGGTFCRRELVIDATRYDWRTGQKLYDNLPAFEVAGEKLCAELDAYREGDMLTVSFDLYGTEYRDRQTGEVRHFTRARAYRMERAPEPRTRQAAAPIAPTLGMEQAPAAPSPQGGEAGNDLPF